MTHCTYSVSDKNASGDNFYEQYICQQEYLDYFGEAYGLTSNKSYQDHNSNQHHACNTPQARMFNACYLLTYSADDYQNDAYDAPQNILQWGRRYIRENFNRLRSLCGAGDTIASCTDGTCEVYLSFFYDHSVAERAAILLHEARHEARGHNANFPVGSVFGCGGDADSHWDHQGAWTFEAGYLCWFYGAGTRTTSAAKERARQAANVIIDNAFTNHPGFNV
ncbi:hypothetical protein SG34_018930 [Thalassomonas viridans]|uniref:Uncharacterized protein n=1 Tax=Thalassomonas viridans TaxID=137584 RepID=A0AAE9YYA3_9GAMM|nr:hypothetical protein [Thalassomonas viridans]WDE03456.1 hypothetical protein SG34_018930 [Thalassomonas viridans]